MEPRYQNDSEEEEYFMENEPRYKRQRKKKRYESPGKSQKKIENLQTNQFFFKQRRGKLNWKLLSQIDPYQVMEDNDIETLESITKNITFSKVGRKEMQYIPEDSFLKIFQLSQLVIEYLLFIQNYLFDKRKEAELNCSKFMEREIKINNQLNKKVSQVHNLRNSVKKLKKTLLVYQLAFGANPEKAKLILQNLKINNLSAINGTNLGINQTGIGMTNQTTIFPGQQSTILQEKNNEITKLTEMVGNLQKEIRNKKKEDEINQEETILKENRKFDELATKYETLLKKTELQQHTIEEQNTKLMKQMMDYNSNGKVMDSLDLNRKIELKLEETMNDFASGGFGKTKPMHQETNNKEEMKMMLNELLKKQKRLDHDALELEKGRIDDEEHKLAILNEKRKLNERKRKLKQKENRMNQTQKRTFNKETIQFLKTFNKDQQKDKLNALVSISEGTQQLLNGNEPLKYQYNPDPEFPFLQALFNHSEKVVEVQNEVTKKTVDNFLKKKINKRTLKRGKITDEQFNKVMGNLRLDQVERNDRYQTMLDRIKGFANKLVRSNIPFGKRARKRTLRAAVNTVVLSKKMKKDQKKSKNGSNTMKSFRALVTKVRDQKRKDAGKTIPNSKRKRNATFSEKELKDSIQLGRKRKSNLRDTLEDSFLSDEFETDDEYEEEEGEFEYTDEEYSDEEDEEEYISPIKKKVQPKKKESVPKVSKPKPKPKPIQKPKPKSALKQKSTKNAKKKEKLNKTVKWDKTLDDSDLKGFDKTIDVTDAITINEKTKTKREELKEEILEDKKEDGTFDVEDVKRKGKKLTFPKRTPKVRQKGKRKSKIDVEKALSPKETSENKKISPKKEKEELEIKIEESSVLEEKNTLKQPQRDESMNLSKELDELQKGFKFDSPEKQDKLPRSKKKELDSEIEDTSKFLNTLNDSIDINKKPKDGKSLFNESSNSIMDSSFNSKSIRDLNIDGFGNSIGKSTEDDLMNMELSLDKF